MAVALTKYRFTVDDYHRMGEAGILTEDDRVELLDGEIVAMAPIGDRHAGEVGQLSSIFTRLLGEQVIVWVQNPIILGPHWEPQPDICLLRPRPDFYKTGKPHAEDVLLVIEVADTTLEMDRQVKIPKYGRVELPEAWILDINDPGLLVFREPYEDGYRSVERISPGDSIAPLAFPNHFVAIADLF